ncbi:MAG: hypothetical protein DWQ45_26010 [Planctomycetota bacterium]|nr:MAG: hypothetical protein DWQ41_26990 [Planctomycetota bacterium]REK27538.1 MAG: hypothetical protein DWQ45_26010 [Planctomycetota bacterium]
MRPISAVPAGTALRLVRPTGRVSLPVALSRNSRMRAWVIARSLFATGLILLAALHLCSRSRAADSAPRKVVLIAGPKSHGPVGNGIHDYPWSVKLLKVMLDNSNVSEHVVVEYHIGGWPEDETTLGDADTIMVVSDGRDGDKYEEAPHFASEQRAALVQRQIDRGCGFVTFHFSTFAPDNFAQQSFDWTGGYFDWDENGRWYSAIEVHETEIEPATPEHPLLRGVAPFSMKEEFYFNIRFPESDAAGKVVPILSVPVLPGREPDGNVVAWARERPDGGRGFATTCGHFYDNWRHAEFRKLILNALVWTAGLEPPASGVEARYYTHREITAALAGRTGTERAVVEEEPIRVLIFAGNEAHKWHNWEQTTPAIRAQLELDPRVRVDVSNDIEDLARRPLEDYDVIVQNSYANWQDPTPLSVEARKSFVNFMQRGGGLILIHFANGAWHYSLPMAGESDWPEYRNIVRRVWNHDGEGDAKSGHDAFGPYTVEVLDVDHPVIRGLSDFDVVDELYYRQDGTAPIEPLIAARSKDTGRDEPLAWTYTYGKGRVFQTLLGHSERTYEAFEACEMLRRAVAWCAKRRVVEFDPATAPAEQPQEGAQTQADDPPEKKKRGAAALREENAAAGEPNHWGREVVGFDWFESDSVDGRWQETDVGDWLACLVGLPGGTVRKGLTIRVSDDRDAAVCYDTEFCRLRGAWTGGFLKFNPARYGLIGTPLPDGDPLFFLPEGPGWGDDAIVQYRGMYPGEDRVVLEYEVDAVLVRESPWAGETGTGPFVVRTLQVAPADRSMVLNTLSGAEGEVTAITVAGRPALHVKRDDTNWFAVAVADEGVAKLTESDEPTGAFEIQPHGETISLHIVYFSAPNASEQAAEEILGSIEQTPFDESWMQPADARWTEDITTQGLRSDADAAYVVDTITIPFDNPYHALFFVGGHDFFSDGRVALCTAHGDVWTVSGVDENLEDLTWRRYATGLFQPLGLKIIDDVVHVLGRDQITRLYDRNADGEADHYECFSNLHFTSAGGHDYVACLETDSEGNFWFVHATQGVVKVAADGQSLETVATGLRNPNGMGLGPGDVVTVAPQEGEWTPASGIFVVQPGAHFGFRGPQVTDNRPLGYDRPIAWIPRREDNSSGGQVWATNPDWGPLAGKMLHLSYGQCRPLLVLKEVVNGVKQAGVLTIPADFDSGIMRGRVSPHDGQLYLSGLRGWTTRAVTDGCLQRLRYTGKRTALPTAVRTMQNGLSLTFSEPLDPDTAQDPGNYAIEQWNYRYSESYGSPDWSVANPNQEGRDPVDVLSATLMDEGRTVFIETPPLVPVNQFAVTYRISAASGERIRQTYTHTLHAVPEEMMDPTRLVRREPAGALPEEVEAALAPGLRWYFRQTVDEVRVQHVSFLTSRVAALAVAGDERLSLGLQPGPFLAIADGYLRIDLSNDYRFSAEGNGRVRLSINEQTVFSAEGADLRSAEAQIAALHKGYNRIEIEYESPPDGASRLRILWGPYEAASRSALRPQFGTTPMDTLPPESLYWNGDRYWGQTTDEQRAHTEFLTARELFAVSRCARCHGPFVDADETADVMPELLADAPRLSGLRGRLTPEWVSTWLIDPESVRDHHRMPAMLEGFDESTSRQHAADLTAWLFSAENDGVENESVVVAPDESADADVGQQLFEDLGCITCHHFGKPELADDYDRLSLDFVTEKFTNDGLRGFLTAPHAHYRYSRMPDFRLTAEQAAALATYLHKAADGELNNETPLPQGDSPKGRDLFVSIGCANCHTDGRNQPPELIRPKVRIFPKTVPFLGTDPRSSGCLKEGEKPPLVPDYGFSDEERAELAKFVMYGRYTLLRSSIVQSSERLIRQLRCTSCHNRDGEQSSRRLIVVEEGRRGLVPEHIPNLTWTGEKLRTGWIARLLKGEIDEPMRPWLPARMPAFPAYADILAEGLAAQHGLLGKTDEPSGPEVANDALVDLGRELTMPAHLDCRQCHGVGSDQPRGDEKTRIALGINFMHIQDRMRHDFYRRFVLDPPKYDINIRMPRLAAEDGTTRVQSILGGDASAQFEAIWEFIQSLPNSTAGE